MSDIYIDRDPDHIARGVPVGYLGGTGCFGQPLASRPFGRVEYRWTLEDVAAGPAVVSDASPVAAGYGTVGSG